MDDGYVGLATAPTGYVAVCVDAGTGEVTVYPVVAFCVPFTGKHAEACVMDSLGRLIQCSKLPGLDRVCRRETLGPTSGGGQRG